jgi:hypothetical protein
LRWYLNQLGHILLRYELAVVSKFGLTWVARFQEAFESNLSSPEGQFVIYSVESGLLLFDVARLSYTNTSRILLEGVNTYLLLLFGDGLWSLLCEIYILKMLHFAINNFLPQT